MPISDIFLANLENSSTKSELGQLMGSNRKLAQATEVTKETHLIGLFLKENIYQRSYTGKEPGWIV